MIWHIAKKEFRINLISARFIIALLLCLLLIPVTMIVSVDSFKNQYRSYQVAKGEAEKEQKNWRVYSAVKPTIVFPPQPLSVFCQGISGQMGHSVKIKLGEKPLLGEGQTNGRDNLLLLSFFSIDFVHILAILISLLALVFSYDLFSGEKENGTLKLMLSNSIGKSAVIAGKITGVFLTLVPILLFCYLISVLIILLTPQISFSASDWFVVLFLFLTSLLFMAFFVSIGILVSVKSSTSFNGIVISLFLWLWFLFLWPNIAVYFAQSNVKIGMLDQLQQSMAQYDQELYKKRDEISNKLHDLGNWWNCNGGDDDYFELTGAAMPTMDAERNLREQFEPIRINYADKKWALQHDYLEKLERQEKIARYSSFLSPSGLFGHLSTMICKTGSESYQELSDQTRIYRDVLIKYFQDNKIFASFKYITPQPEKSFFKTGDDQINFVTGGICKTQKELKNWMDAHNGSWSVLWTVPYPEGSYNTYPPLDLSALPKFTKYKQEIDKSLPSIFIEAGTLLIIFILLFSLIFNLCIKYDVR
jgi:ABC-type transport system involved in multi-copper enzyme maturation permease subunit